MLVLLDTESSGPYLRTFFMLTFRHAAMTDNREIFTGTHARCTIGYTSHTFGQFCTKKKKKKKKKKFCTTDKLFCMERGSVVFGCSVFPLPPPHILGTVMPLSEVTCPSPLSLGALGLHGEGRGTKGKGCGKVFCEGTSGKTWWKRYGEIMKEWMRRRGGDNCRGKRGDGRGEMEEGMIMRAIMNAAWVEGGGVLFAVAVVRAFWGGVVGDTEGLGGGDAEGRGIRVVIRH